MTDTTAYDEYLHALRDLDNVRAAQDHAATALRLQRSGADADLQLLRGRLDIQRDELGRLAAECGLPEPPNRATPTPPPADAATELTLARGDADAAEENYRDARFLAHRPRLLPRWRTDERNGLVYGGYALVSLLIQVAVLASAAGTENFWDMLVEVLTCVVLPLPAWAAGWVTIGVVARPRLGEGTLGPNGKLARNPRMGLVIAFSTLIVSCALGNIYLK